MSISAHDDYSRTPVANFKLRPWWYLLIIEMGVMISIPIFIVGGQLGRSLCLRDLFLATFGGAIILGVIGGLTARLGSITRCSTPLIAQVTFGPKGASFITLLLATAMTGWWGVQTEFFGQSVSRLIATVSYLNISPELMALVGGCAMITTAALGIRAIGKLAYLAVPLLSAGMCFALMQLSNVGAYNYIYHYQPHTSTLSVGAAAAMVAGGFIVGALMNPDYARFAINTKHALIYALTDYVVIYPLLLVASGVIAVWYNSNDIIIHFVPTGFTWLVFLMIMFATWAANDCNLYSSSLSLATLIKGVQRSHLAIAAGVFIISAWRRSKAITEEKLLSIPDWHWKALFAWLCGAIVGIATTSKEALGLGLFSLTTVSPLDAIIVAAVVMLIIRFVQRDYAPVNMDSLPVRSSKSTDAVEILTR